MKRTLYQVLYVRPDATPEMIYWAYQTLLRSAADAALTQEAENELKFAGHAYSILSDPDRRAAYDRELEREAFVERLVANEAAAAGNAQAVPQPRGGWLGHKSILLAAVMALLVAVSVFAQYVAATRQAGPDAGASVPGRAGQAQQR